jgi:hypothetical protein
MGYGVWGMEYGVWGYSERMHDDDFTVKSAMNIRSPFDWKMQICIRMRMINNNNNNHHHHHQRRTSKKKLLVTIDCMNSWLVVGVNQLENRNDYENAIELWNGYDPAKVLPPPVVGVVEEEEETPWYNRFEFQDGQVDEELANQGGTSSSPTKANFDQLFAGMPSLDEICEKSDFPQNDL